MQAWVCLEALPEAEALVEPYRWWQIFQTTAVQMYQSLSFGPLYGPAHVQATPQRGFDESVASLPQLLWYEGKPCPPRFENSQYLGHPMYQGATPIVVTGKKKDMGPVIAQGPIALARHTMLLRRLRIYSFTRPLQPSKQHIHECACCFVQLILRFGLWSSKPSSASHIACFCLRPVASHS